MVAKYGFGVCLDTTHVCGCPTCDIASDNFNRANESPLASPWTKLSGTDANLFNNVLEMTAAAFYRHNTAYSGAATESRNAKVKFKIPSAGSTNIELCIGITDVNNYFLARVNIPASGCPVLSACAVVAGVSDCGLSPSDPGGDVILEGLDQGVALINVPKTTVDEWHTLEVCLSPNTGSYGYATYDELRVKLTLADGTIYATRFWVEGPAIGAYAGVKATGAAKFDDFFYRFFRNSPTNEHRSCPNCNTPCFIGSDDFTTDQPCNWHQASGSAYAVGLGVMTVAASSSVAFALPHPMYKTSGIITVDLIWDAGIIARIDLGCGAGSGTNGAGYVLLNSTDRTMKLYNNAGTLLDTATDLPVADGLYYPVTLCHHDGVLTATAFGKCVSGNSSGTVTNPFAFLGAGAGNAVRYDNFVFKKARDTEEPSDGGCEECECQTTVTCDNCLDSLAPQYLKCVIPNDVLGGSGEACIDCTLAQGTHVLEAPGAAPFLCSWGPNSSGAICLNDLLAEYAVALDARVLDTASLNYDGGPSPGTYRLRVVMKSDVSGDANAHIVWEKDYGLVKPDCLTWQNESVPWVRNNDPGCYSNTFLPVLITSI